MANQQLDLAPQELRDLPAWGKYQGDANWSALPLVDRQTLWRSHNPKAWLPVLTRAFRSAPMTVDEFGGLAFANANRAATLDSKRIELWLLHTHFYIIAFPQTLATLRERHVACDFLDFERRDATIDFRTMPIIQGEPGSGKTMTMLSKGDYDCPVVYLTADDLGLARTPFCPLRSDARAFTFHETAATLVADAVSRLVGVVEPDPSQKYMMLALDDLGAFPEFVETVANDAGSRIANELSDRGYGAIKLMIGGVAADGNRGFYTHTTTFSTSATPRKLPCVPSNRPSSRSVADHINGAATPLMRAAKALIANRRAEARMVQSWMEMSAKAKEDVEAAVTTMATHAAVQHVRMSGVSPAEYLDAVRKAIAAQKLESLPVTDYVLLCAKLGVLIDRSYVNESHRFEEEVRQVDSSCPGLRRYLDVSLASRYEVAPLQVGVLRFAYGLELCTAKDGLYELAGDESGEADLSRFGG